MLRWMMMLLWAGVSAWAVDYEAEPGTEGSPATVQKLDGASGGAILRFTGSSQMKKDMIDFAKPDKVIPFTTDRDGSWKFTATVCSEHTGNDSVYFRIDDGPVEELHVGFPHKLVVKPMGSFDLEKGSHKIAFYRREPGLGLDKISMTWEPRKPKMVYYPGKPGPDAVYTVKAVPGTYVLRIFASVKEAGPQRNATITVGDQRPVVRRIIFPTVTSGRYEVDRVRMKTKPVNIRIQTDEEVTISHIRLEPVRKVLPEAAEKYVPVITPRPDRPRVYVNRETLAKIKENIKKGPQHKKAWAQISAIARKPYVFAPVPGKEVMWNAQLVNAMHYKAFYYLITGDKKIAREACELAVAYFKAVNFGNGQDICRRTGEAIRVASMVYDWCYDVMTDAERAILRDRFLWQAESMEIGWPPFLQPITVGHGNEAQLNKDLLAMATAIYNEDPVPWKYCIYRLVEESRPMKSDLYRSGYHYEGSAYGTVRYDSDLNAAFQLKLATGFDMFEPYVGKVPYAWFHWRLPDGDMFRDGDDYMRTKFMPGFAPIYLVANALWPDPKLKSGYMEYYQKKSQAFDTPFYFLAMMLDPDQAQDDRRDDLPKVKYFGEPLSMLSARTGWENSFVSEDVLVQMTGVGIHNSSHQHHDAGAFQMYYRGLQVSDIGQYRYFGKPYDWDFAKSSMSHSVMRIIDPQKKAYRWPRHQHLLGAGLQEVPPYGPALLSDVQKNRAFYDRGTLLSVSEDVLTPHLQVELSPSYGERTKKYVRTMVFLAAEKPALVVFDEMEFPRPDIKPVWQVTTFAKPVVKDGKLVTDQKYMGLPSRLTVTTLLPRKHETLVLSGKDAHTVLGKRYYAPYPEHPGASGSRTEITAAAGEDVTRFLNILQPTPGTEPAPVKMTEKNGVITLVSDGWSLILTPGKAPVAKVTKPRKAYKPVKDTLYLDGKAVCKITDGKVPLVWLLNAKGIQWTETNGILQFEDMTIVPKGKKGPENSVQVAQKNGMWVVTPEEAAGLIYADLLHDHWNNSDYLASRPGKAQWRVATVTNGSLSDWNTLLAREEDSFIVEGKTVATATFRSPRKLEGVALRYLYGDQRTDKLKIEISEDGKNFKTVFDGITSGKSSAFQDFKFPAQTVLTLRFTLDGNSVNEWNNLSGLKVIPAE